MKFLMMAMIALAATFAQAQTELGGFSSHFTPAEEGLTPSPRLSSRLFLQNTCYTDIWVAIQTMGPLGQWESKGFFHLFPGQISYLTSFQNSFYYLHGFTSDRRVYWQGPHTMVLNGQVLPALMIHVQPPRGGDWTTVLYCY